MYKPVLLSIILFMSHEINKDTYVISSLNPSVIFLPNIYLRDIFRGKFIFRGDFSAYPVITTLVFQEAV